MRIFFQIGTSKKFAMDVDPKDKVFELKTNLLSSEGNLGESLYPTSQEVLKEILFFFQGKLLDDRSTLEKNGVYKDSCIIVKPISTKTTSAMERGRRGGMMERGRRGWRKSSDLLLFPEEWLNWLMVIGIILLLLTFFSYAEIVRRSLPIAPVPPSPPPPSSPPPPPPPPRSPPPPPPKPNVNFHMYMTLGIQWPASYVIEKENKNILEVPKRPTLHGLWPVPAFELPSSGMFDFSMGKNRELIARASLNWPNLDPIPNLRDPPSLAQHNRQFWRHEWNKHGAKSGLSQEVYMTLALDLFDEVAPFFNYWVESGTNYGSSSRRKGEFDVSVNTFYLAKILTQNIAIPKINCRTVRETQIFYSVYFRVLVKVIGSLDFPQYEFVDMHFSSDDGSKCHEFVALP